MTLIIALVLGFTAFVGAGWMAKADLPRQQAPALRRYRLAFRWAIALAALATMAYCTTGIQWPEAMTNPGQGVQLYLYAMVVAVGLAPYALLLALSSRMEVMPRLQLMLVGAVAVIAISFFSRVRSAGTPSGGWEFFIVPALQLAMIAGVCVVGGALVRFWQHLGRQARR